MKRWPQVLFVIVLALVQTTIVTILPGSTTNFLLAYFVVAALFLDYQLLLWLALLAGVLLDLSGTTASFGFNIGFFLLVVIISKLIMRAEDQTQRLLYSIFLTIGFSIVYFAIATGLIIGSLSHIQISQLLIRLIITICYNISSTVLIFILFEYGFGKNQHHRSVKGGLL